MLRFTAWRIASGDICCGTHIDFEERDSRGDGCMRRSLKDTRIEQIRYVQHTEAIGR